MQWHGVGLLLVVAGGLITFRGWIGLLMGHDRTTTIPEDVVADVAGSTVLRIGIAAAAIGGLLAITRVPSSLSLVFGAAILLAVGRMLPPPHLHAPGRELAHIRPLLPGLEDSGVDGSDGRRGHGAPVGDRPAAGGIGRVPVVECASRLGGHGSRWGSTRA